MTTPVRAELLLNIANWQKNLEKSSKQMAGFGKSMKTISTGIKAAFAGIAIVGIGNLYDGIVDVTKAAAEDAKSQALLNVQMKKTWGGNDKINKSIDDQINALAAATGVVDDKLRPALIRIAGVTKSPVKGMKALKLSLDIAAKSGKDLGMVSMNMAKFLGGNKTALDKLVPGLSKSGDRMKFLKENYEGFAEIAGRNDPFGRINVVVENFKEKLGMAFLPIANNVADWLAGDEAQKELDKIANWVQDTFKWFTSPEAAAMFSEWYTKAKELLDTVVGMVDGLGKFLGMIPGMKKTPLQQYEERLKENTAKYGKPKLVPGGDTVFRDGQSRTTLDSFRFTPGQRNDVNVPKNGDVTNIYVTGMINAKEVISELGKLARKKGVPLSKLLA